jgi:hypothetical protein
MHRDDVPLRKHCGADFGEMTPIAPDARRCEQCSTPVHDLTNPEVPTHEQTSARRCIRYLYDARGDVIRGALPAGAIIIPARKLLTKRRRERWLAIASVAAFPLLLEACGEDIGPASDAGADADADAGTDGDVNARVTADAAVGRD